MVMANFFNNFKNQFDSDLGGRYFSVVLQSLFLEYPEFLHEINPKISRKIKIIEIELERSSNDESKIKKYRRSDLSVDYTDVDNSKTSKTLNIEIKWKDDLLEGQLEHYIKQAKKTGNLFALVTLERQDEETLLLIAKNKEFCTSITCPEFYRKLEKKLDETKDNWLLRNFLTFLKENAMIYTEQMDRAALDRLIKNSIGVIKYDGRGKTLTQTTKDDVPNLLKQLMDNVCTVAENFYGKHRDLFSLQRPITNFKVNSAIAASKNPEIYDDYIWCGYGKNTVEAGDFRIYSTSYFDKEFTGNSRYYSCLEVGVIFQYTRGQMSLRSYAEIYWRDDAHDKDHHGNDTKIHDILADGKEYKFPTAENLDAKIQKNIRSACQKFTEIEQIKQLHDRLA